MVCYWVWVMGLIKCQIVSQVHHTCYHMLTETWLFSHNVWRVTFRWCLSDSKSLWVSRTHLIILAYFNSSVVLMPSLLLLITSYSTLFSSSIEIILLAPTTVGTNFMFHSFFNSDNISSSRFLEYFTLWSAGATKSTRRQIHFFSKF